MATAAPDPYTPREGWVIIYWDADRTRWEIGLGCYTDKDEARQQAALYRHELGTVRAGMIHTSDRE